MAQPCSAWTRSRLAIALRNVNSPNGLWAIRTFPQGRRQLRQIKLCLRREPFDALPIHTRSAFVGADFRPRHRQRFGCEHLIHHTEPFAAFDAVLQRRSCRRRALSTRHALRPHRSFDATIRPAGSPRVGLCAVHSLIGTCGALLLRLGHHVSTFLPRLPSARFMLPVPLVALAASVRRVADAPSARCGL